MTSLIYLLNGGLILVTRLDVTQSINLKLANILYSRMYLMYVCINSSVEAGVTDGLVRGVFCGLSPSQFYSVLNQRPHSLGCFFSFSILYICAVSRGVLVERQRCLG